MIQGLARDFAAGEVAPIAARIDETGEFPLETVRKMGAIGLMGITAPEAYGGVGADLVSYVLAMVEISKGRRRHATSCRSKTRWCCNGLAHFRHRRRKSSATSRRSRAARDRRLRAHRAAVGLRRRHMRSAPCRPTATLRHQRQEELDHLRPGGQVHRRFRDDRPGGRHAASPRPRGRDRQARLPPRQDRAQARHPRLGHLRDRFHDYAPGRRARLGEEGHGLQDRHGVLDARPHRHRRAGASASPRPPTRRRSPTPASARPSASRSARFQAIQSKIADMSDQLQAAQLLTLRAARQQATSGCARPTRASMAKLYASETADVDHRTRRCRSTAAWATPRRCRWSATSATRKITEIYEGTSEIQRLVISRNVLA